MPHSRSIPAACGLLAVAFLAPVLPSHAATITVPSDYPTMQKALDAAASGDTVLVLPGTYAGDGNRDLDFQGKDVVLRSRDGANVTTVEIGGSPFPLEEHRAVLFDEGETSAAVVEGFTFTGGLAFDDGAVIGILGASPTIRGCVLHDNTNSMVVVIDGDPVFRDCEFRGARATAGGAIAFLRSSAEIYDCHFEGSWVGQYGSGSGGAIAAKDSPLHIERCEFVDNSAFPYGSGGAANFAASVSPFPPVVMIDCVFRENSSAWDGGAVFCSGIDLEASGCVFLDNYGGQTGGAVSLNVSHATLTECTLVTNSSPEGCGIYAQGGSTLTIGKTIIASGHMSEAITLLEASTAALSCSDLFGNEGGDWTGSIAGQLGVDGNISADPLFCGPAAGDYQLDAASPCLGAACGRMGAFGEGCDGFTTGVASERYQEPASWGSVKTRF